MDNVAARYFDSQGSGYVDGTQSQIDIPDQTAIVRQYMRYTAQINSGRNVAQVVKRALQM